MPTSRPTARTQADRSAETKGRLIDATVACLVDYGYARTTTVEICSRAGLTRGAYNHHYAGTEALFTDVLEQLYLRFAKRESDTAHDDSLERLIREGWAKMKRPEFKAVIELWLASRNDPSLGASLAPAIARLSRIFEPRANPSLGERLDADPDLVALYRLAFEATIGLALGRATSPNGSAVQHENQVLDLLLSLARDQDRRQGAERP